MRTCSYHHEDQSKGLSQIQTATTTTAPLWIQIRRVCGGDGSKTSHLKSTKRARNAMASTPPPSPQKKRINISSAITEGLLRIDSGNAPVGLFRFMKKCTREEYEEQTRQAALQSQANWEQDQADREAREAQKLCEKQEAETNVSTKTPSEETQSC